ncbi:CocE/NonD family hydrolase [Arthrobacter sp.]|uniref:CocE/NonD family hydrolase n=1 Tax=Arthrobacter sp. TaxID=1667 RepID=UPI003A92D176
MTTTSYGKKSPSPINDIRIQLNAVATMRDGTELRADIYRPDDGQSHPVIVMRHPYSKSREPMLRDVDIVRVVKSGYVLVFQDVRGRFASDGLFEPSLHEEHDGADTVRWAATLPGSDGRVGMWGSSYGAETQWSAALGGPEPLRSIVPINPPSHSVFNGFLMRGGAHEFGSRLNWAHGSIAFEELRRSHTGLDAGSLVSTYSRTQKRFDSQEIYDLRPFSRIHDEVPGFLADASKTFGESAEAPWRHVSRTQGRYADIKPAAFIVGGWFDCFLGSTLSQYAGLHAASADSGAQTPHLLIGPWSHRQSTDRLGDLAFGSLAKATHACQGESLTGQIVRWFDATIKDKEEALIGVPPVRLFMMGINQWLGFEEFPPPASKVESWHFGPDNSLLHTGSIEPGTTSYTYDPEDPAPTLGGAILLAPEFPVGPVAQNELYERDDVISFTSEPLASALHVLGTVTVNLHAASDAVDTDFVASLCDVHPDGSSILIANGIVRVSERDSFTIDGVYLPGRRKPAEPGEDLELHIGLLATAHAFLAGHRLRVDITSSSFPRWDANPNTGGTIYDSDTSKVARQTVKFGKLHPSRIELPVVSANSVRAAHI